MDTKTVKTPQKKLCLVSVLPPIRSGVALYTAGLLSGFAKQNATYDVVILSNKSDEKDKPEFERVRVSRTWNRDCRYFYQVLHAIVKEKPNVVHLQHEFFLFGGMLTAALFPLLILLIKFQRIKTVITLHGIISKTAANNEFAEAFFVPKNYFLIRIGLGSLTTAICRIADTIIVHSLEGKETLIKDFGIPTCKIKVVPHGIGLRDSNESLNDSSKSVLFFGNITPSKGLETLISAFEQVKVQDAKLIIAGGPHPRGAEYFRKITNSIQNSKKSDQIAITGYVPDGEIHSLFEKCQVAVFPYKFSVSCSGGLSFALQHRKPSIVTSLPSFTEVIVDGINGLVVPPRDELALAAAIERLLSDENLQECLSRGIDKKCTHLHWPDIASETIKCY
jgi:glycosyltransferase involved in cell wall biosynthesis